jgi:hypothetical protein
MGRAGHKFGKSNRAKLEGPWRKLASTLIPEYPRELLWHGRGPDQNFEPDEPLYYRVEKFDGRGKVSVLDVHCPDMSVNRGKYSQPEHVLYAKLPQFLGHRVARFYVRDIPGQVRSGDGRDFRFAIVHEPIRPPEELDENYAHSEIHAFLGGERKKRVSNLVSKEFRQILSERMTPIPGGT